MPTCDRTGPTWQASSHSQGSQICQSSVTPRRGFSLPRHKRGRGVCSFVRFGSDIRKSYQTAVPFGVGYNARPQACKQGLQCVAFPTHGKPRPGCMCGAARCGAVRCGSSRSYGTTIVRKNAKQPDPDRPIRTDVRRYLQSTAWPGATIRIFSADKARPNSNWVVSNKASDGVLRRPSGWVGF